MTKKIKHSLETLIEKSLQKKATQAEEDLLEGFMLSEYEKTSWEKNLMGTAVNGFGKIEKHIAKKRISRYMAYAVAASVVVLLSLGLLIQPEVSDSAKMLTLKTGKSSDSVRLADGSVIYLAANSVFEYPDHFAEDRQVKLIKGKAFFEVAKDPQHPFIIRSGDVQTRVVGTSFHIQMNKSSCNVIVVAGKVNVSAKNQSVDLVSNEEALFEANTLVKKKASKMLVVNWYNEDIELKNVKLHEVLELLKNKYNVTFEVKKDSLLNTSLTLYIEKNAALENILKQINYISNLKFETNGNTITVN
ncbi:FecR family protein [Flavobacterium sp. ARAG 55.4]|uniref:FecR family protein n=1 Tax=Flavobacterium sp. ARAG 55.4 TaxID=3451357 RepID=UPI003F450666